MKTVYKYKIPLGVSVSVILPVGAKPVFTAVQEDEPTLWFEHSVHGMFKTEMRRFKVFGTGMDIPDKWNHVGSCTDGVFVWHVYEFTENQSLQNA